MRALVYENRISRLALTKLLSAFSARAFVGPLVVAREVDPCGILNAGELRIERSAMGRPWENVSVERL